MRIQEHLYQGFFGLKKKKDAAKYYHNQVDKLKGFDDDLDTVIELFQKVLANHNAKLKSYSDFLKKPNNETFRAVAVEIQKLEGMFDEDEKANEREQKYVLKGLDKLNELLKDDESPELIQLEQEDVTDLKELMRLLRSIDPVWQAQIDFVKQNGQNIMANPKNITILSNIFKEEGSILQMEESLLRKIDLKTGTILRKASLMERDIQRTKEMDMTYREIKYVR